MLVHEGTFEVYGGGVPGLVEREWNRRVTGMGPEEAREGVGTALIHQILFFMSGLKLNSGHLKSVPLK